MKRNITLTLALLFIQLAFAQYGQTGNLTVFSEAGEPFFLILNGQRQNDKPQTNLRVEALRQPYYSAKIIFADKSIPEVSTNNLSLTDADEIYQDVTYRIKSDRKDPKKRKLSFFSMIPAEQNFVAPPDLYVVNYGQPAVNTNVNFSTSISTNINMGLGVNVNVTETHTQTQSGGFYDNTPAYQPAPVGCNQSYPMGPRDFTAAVASVKKQNFADTQLKIAKQVVGANCLSTNQISELARVFKFEENALDFAKFAYDFCTDPQNYYKLSDVFKFSSNAEDLSDYVSGRH